MLWTVYRLQKLDVDVRQLGTKPELRGLLIHYEPHGTADAGATDPAVTTGIFRKVLLVVVFRVIECVKRQNLGRNIGVASLRQLGLVGNQ